jgi:hypothetical protein
MLEVPQGEPTQPWRGFLRDLDAALSAPVELVCLGGFVVALAYGAGRATSDIDVLLVRAEGTDNVEMIAGLGSGLHRRHRLYLQRVGISTPPANYVSRLRPLGGQAPWRRLRLSVLDPIDLALTKVERNADVDRRDVIALARAGWLDAAIFRARYAEEVAPYLLAHHQRHDDTAESFARLIEASAPDGTSRR